MPIESGRYIITHAQYWNLAFLSDANDGTSLLGCLEQDLPGEEWNVKELRNGRYSIANFGHKMSASAVSQAQKGEHVVGREGGSIWLIKEHDSGGEYTISTANDKLRWWLDDSLPDTPITLHDAPPSDPRCHWTFQKIGRMNTAHHEAAVVNAELARKEREVEVAREEVTQAKAVAAENKARREEAEVEVSMKAAEVEQVKRELDRCNVDAFRKAEEVEEAKREVARAKLEVVRILAEWEATRRELTAVKAVAAENEARREQAEAEASTKAAEVKEAKQEAVQSNADASRMAEEVEEAKREVAQAKLEVVRILAELEAARREAAEAKAVAAENAVTTETLTVSRFPQALDTNITFRQQVDQWFARNKRNHCSVTYAERGPQNARLYQCTYLLNLTTDVMGDCKRNKPDAKESAAREVMQILNNPLSVSEL